MPETSKKLNTRPENTAPPSHYPVALVPGQFQEYYRKLSAAELLYVFYQYFEIIFRSFCLAYAYVYLQMLSDQYSAC